MTPYERKRIAESLEAKNKRAARIKRRIASEQDSLKTVEGEIRELMRKLEQRRAA